ncbi:MAG: bifunctional glutamate--cysteine ligase GshA/glutathione synthetase GshB [Marinifilaceae bacterium]|jgi:glutamate--cysteine ligase|nr:bifunctional glutamate--cysteine ligase GshA/glutathione synthetase GshB [Marinifilaceae bacterium]
MEELNKLYSKIKFLNIHHGLLEAKFGIEKENVRVDLNGNLATTPHPEFLGDKLENPYYTTDFSESQVEMITPPMDSIEEVHGFISTLHDMLSEKLDGELLWPQSIPPILPNEEEIPIAKYGSKGSEKEIYREELASKYGKARQLLSGVHFNFSLNPKLESLLYKSIDSNLDFEEFRNNLYLKIVRNFMRFRWILVYLFGCSPKTDPDFKMKSLKTGGFVPTKCSDSISIRTGSAGYRNPKDFFICFDSLDSFFDSVNQLIESGDLLLVEELYLPIRLKFDKDNRLSHLELRIVDLKPEETSGVNIHELRFNHVFLLFCLFYKENKKCSEEDQVISTYNHDKIACCGLDPNLEIFNLDGEKANVREVVKNLFNEIQDFAVSTDILGDEKYCESIEFVKSMLEGNEVLFAERVRDQVNKYGYIDYHLNKAKQHRDKSLKEGYKFHGFEDMELSTQLLMKAAIDKSINIDILDKSENILKLEKDNKVEYVKQATKTSVDTYSSVLMMENKSVTKKILDKNNINSPRGSEYSNKDKAYAAYLHHKNKSIVIKPNSTNFGIGISILLDNNSEETYKKAVDIAFENDKLVLIEEFISGKEYRFFVINDKVEGILHRVPANIKGDGKSSIRELIEIKNKNSLRGQGYRTPLEKIKMGEAESMFLAQQKLDFDSVIENDKIVYLRENSNISTGGDSIDFTDEMHQSYKDIAVEAAKALGVRITGIDIMILDIAQPANQENYSIIELNFNPAIHIHCYPFVGKNRHLNHKIIKALGF